MRLFIIALIFCIEMQFNLLKLGDGSQNIFDATIVAGMVVIGVILAVIQDIKELFR